ncbi:hypothetical protein [Planomonospora sp. ID82291]|uniref:hypothetical protein n=1 Tax=Planomonospora sp. ID82291 TaxID=2738136 RepID=UPI0018C44D12|nr:hypothetical protein [Planomonospora sp. ID82291]MBG0816003.1 hypothetical protein [Planomonospora sp. ID82291]
MADLTTPASPNRIAPVGVIAGGALLVVAAFLPWAGVRADIAVLGSLSQNVRGVDDWSGILALIGGTMAAVIGVAGGDRPFTALAALPGAVTTAVLLVFLSDPQGRGRNASFTVGDLVRVEPTVEYGWFVALAAALAVTGFAATALASGRRLRRP